MIFKSATKSALEALWKRWSKEKQMCNYVIFKSATKSALEALVKSATKSTLEALVKR
jgi:hypothetical protein